MFRSVDIHSYLMPLLGVFTICLSLSLSFFLIEAQFIYCHSFGRRYKQTQSRLLPSVSVSAQPAPHIPPKRSMSSHSAPTLLKRRREPIRRAMGNLRVTNRSRRRRNPWQVGTEANPPFIFRGRSRNSTLISPAKVQNSLRLTLVSLPILSEEVALCGLCPSLGHDGQEEEKSWEEQLDAHQEQLEREMQEARRMVFRLQVKSRRLNSDARVNTRIGGDRCTRERKHFCRTQCPSCNIFEWTEKIRVMIYISI